MYGKWSQWKPIPDLPGKMYMESLSGSWDEGLKISYQCTDEGNRYKTLGFLHKKYGKDFYAKWTLFEVQDSALIKWVQEESCIGDDLQVKQFTLLTADDVIDIITRYDPDIEVL